MLSGGRKSVEPMAARLQPQNVRSAHQPKHHLVADADWSDASLLTAACAELLPALAKKSRTRIQESPRALGSSQSHANLARPGWFELPMRHLEAS